MLDIRATTFAPYIVHYLNALNITAPMGSFEFVVQLQRQHLATFSFSSINAMQGVYLSLEAEALFDRVINKRQGGYCFEHNRIMYLVLEALGYDVRPALARVMLNGKTDNPRTHRVTLLKFADKTYTIEVGFGVKSPIIPIAVDQSAVFNEGCDQYQVERTTASTTLSLMAPEKLNLYQIDLTEVFEGDCEVGHFYSHQHHEAAFVNHLVVSRIENGQRYLIRNNQFIHSNEHTDVEVVQTIDNVVQLRILLDEYFAITVSDRYLKVAFDKVRTRVAL